VQLRVSRASLASKNANVSGGSTMNDTVNRQVLLVEKPAGKLGPEHFRMTRAAVPEPRDGEALLRVRYISLDAANRAWMHGATYRAAVEANTVMAGGGIAEVVSSKAPGLAPGDIVFGDTGWQDYAAVPAKHLTRMPKVEPMTHLLSVYGIAGLTAYFGLLDVASRRPARPWWSRPPPAQSDRSSARSRKSRAAAWSASPAARTSATG
jgi:NADPH-dependent curcumin reductase CurA